MTEHELAAVQARADAASAGYAGLLDADRP